MKTKFSADFFIALFSGLGCLGGMWGYFEYHFAHADVIDPMKLDIRDGKEEQKEMKAEMDELYYTLVPAYKRRPLAHHHLVGEK